MRIQKAFLGIALSAGLLTAATTASANPPADDFLNPQKGRPHLTLMPFVGPGFRAIYDHRFEIEKDMSEVRTQIMGTVAVPFAEVSANVDIRFFLNSLGGAIGYHNEWHTLQFNPDPATGRDRLGNPKYQGTPFEDPQPGSTDLDRNARLIKDRNADYKKEAWTWFEGRWQTVIPGYGFTGVSTLAVRKDNRPDVTYDWENATVFSGGLHLRWEGYAFFRSRNLGFIGPALRALYVPRHRVPNSQYIPASNVPVYAGSACRPSAVEGLACEEKYEFELQFGIIAGMQPNWASSTDTLLVRAFTTAGPHSELMGTHIFHQPFQLLVAYMVDIDF
jgi:hypothetical protein